MVRKSINYIQDYMGSVVRNVEQLIVIATHLPLHFFCSPRINDLLHELNNIYFISNLCKSKNKYNMSKCNLNTKKALKRKIKLKFSK